jgi:hypothetical protein
MNMKTILFSVAICLALSTSALANPETSKEHDHHKAPKVSKAFESMKALVGSWEGTSMMGGKEMPVTVDYTLTSGGTTLIETLGKGTPHEMITVYSNRGDKVNATHYCMVGNQPEFKLKKSADNQFVFEMDGTKGLSDKSEMHMHGVTLTVAGNKLKQDWTNYKDGKKAENAVFEFTKKN